MFSMLYKTKEQNWMEILGESSTNYDEFHNILTVISKVGDFSITHLHNVLSKENPCIRN